MMVLHRARVLAYGGGGLGWWEGLQGEGATHIDIVYENFSE